MAAADLLVARHADPGHGARPPPQRPRPRPHRLETTASSQMYAAAIQTLREREMTDDEIREYAAQLMGPELVMGR